jgi:hypothetical protein
MFHNVKLNKLWNNIDWPRKLIEFSASKRSPGGTGITSAPPPLGDFDVQGIKLILYQDPNKHEML